MTIPAGGIQGLQGLQLPMLEGTGGASEAPKAASGFGDMLRTKLEDLTKTQVAGETAATDLAAGRADDVAQTMIKVEQANISLQMATQMRNKVIEAYQEILRMQV